VGHPCRVVERRAFEMQVFPHGPDCNAWTWMSGVDQMTVCVGVVTWGRLRRHERPIRARAGPAWLPGAAICGALVFGVLSRYRFLFVPPGPLSGGRSFLQSRPVQAWSDIRI